MDYDILNAFEWSNDDVVQEYHGYDFGRQPPLSSSALQSIHLNNPSCTCYFVISSTIVLIYHTSMSANKCIISRAMATTRSCGCTPSTTRVNDS